MEKYIYLAFGLVIGSISVALFFLWLELLHARHELKAKRESEEPVLLVENKELEILPQKRQNEIAPEFELNPVIEIQPEQDDSETDLSRLEIARQKVTRFSENRFFDETNLDAFDAADKATREYGEAYYAVHKRAPPDL